MNPIIYFEDLITKGIKREFDLYVNEHNINQRIQLDNKSNMTDQEKLDLIKQQLREEYYFLFPFIVTAERMYSQHAIEVFVDNENEIDKLIGYITKTFVRLIYLFRNYPDDESFRKFSIIKEELGNLIIHIHKKYNSFVHKTDSEKELEFIEVIKGFIDDNHKQKTESIESKFELPEISKTHFTFNKVNFESVAISLHHFLNKDELIDCQDFCLFVKKFTGKDNSLPKIKWLVIAEKNKRTNQRALLYLLAKLEKVGIIINWSNDSKTKYNKVCNVFSDNNGNDLNRKNLRKSLPRDNGEPGNSKGYYKKIDDIIDYLRIA